MYRTNVRTLRAKSGWDGLKRFGLTYMHYWYYV